MLILRKSQDIIFAHKLIVINNRELKILRQTRKKHQSKKERYTLCSSKLEDI